MLSKTKRILLILICLSTILPYLYAQEDNKDLAQGVVNVSFYNEWSGINCKYKGDRPFSFITDIYDLHNFWKNSGINEPEPYIDFEKYMLFLWTPGPSKYDWSETQIEKILYKEDAFLVLMDFKRKFKGVTTYPFYAVMMPKRDDYDFFIFRKKGPDKKYVVEWEPYYTMWCMKKIRTKPFTVVKADKESPEKIVPFNQSLPEDYFEQRAKEEEAKQNVMLASLQRPEPTAKEPTIKKPETRREVYTPPSRPVYTPATPTSTVPKTKPTPQTTISQQSSPTVSKPLEEKLPAMDEDPLFGSEFDITF